MSEHSSSGPQRPDGDDPRVTAAEFAMGLLSDAEARAFEARMAEDRALYDEVVAWQEHLADLMLDEVDAVAPSPQLRKRIEARLFRSDAPPFWKQILPYGFGGAAAALVLWLAVSSGLVNPDEDAIEADLVAELAPTPEGEGLVINAAVDTDLGAVQVVRVAGDAPENRVFELWLIAGEAAPVSLGVLDDAADSTVITLPQDVMAELPGAVLAVSDEPPGGSPTGAPTGSVLAAGPLTAS